MIIRWMKRLKWMRISKYALIITLLLSLVFAGFTVYGARTGNFTIYLHSSDVNLAVYMEEDMSDLGTRLTVPTLNEMTDVTFEDLAMPAVRQQIMGGLGSKNDETHKQYMAFSFALVNLSEKMVNYNMELTVTSTYEGIGGGQIISALRVLVIKEWGYENGSVYDSLPTQAAKEEYFRGGRFYALKESTVKGANSLAENTYYKTEDFISSLQLFKQEEYDFEINAQVKYTFVLWLEGWDVDCINDLYGGRIKMRLDITGY